MVPDTSVLEGGPPVRPYLVPEGGAEAETDVQVQPMNEGGDDVGVTLEAGEEVGEQAYCCVTLGSGDTCGCAPYGTVTCASMTCQPIAGETLTEADYQQACTTVVTWAAPAGGKGKEETCVGVTLGVGGGGL